MAYDKLIIEFARALFLERNERGKKVNSLRDISELLYRKFNKKINFTTVALWAKENGWHNEAEILKHIVKENELTEEIKEQTTDMENRFVKDLLKDYQNAKILEKMGYEIVKNIYKGEKVTLKFKDGIQAIKLGNDIKSRIRGLPELTQDPEKEDKKTVWKFGENVIEF